MLNEQENVIAAGIFSAILVIGFVICGIFAFGYGLETLQKYHLEQDYDSIKIGDTYKFEVDNGDPWSTPVCYTYKIIDKKNLYIRYKTDSYSKIHADRADRFLRLHEKGSCPQ